MELGSIKEFLNNNPFWSLVQLDFLQRVLSPLKRKLFPQDLRIYDFVRLSFVVMCCDIINLLTMLFSNIGSFCGEDIEGKIYIDEIDTVINCAATTNFDERYDVALGINTLGPLLLLNFVKKCNNVKVFHLAINTVLFQKPYKDKYTALDRKLKRGMRLAKLYEPYVFFKGIFYDTNSEKLQIAATETCSEANAFNFYPTSVNWEAYMMDVHFLIAFARRYLGILFLRTVL
ncbi:hypothetical protein NC651_040160 [Populus alba x Populus x berolinensis]|nr:hypothetical protein NC651_040160 [Populus alba x Populus x berolinensis]